MNAIEDICSSSSDESGDDLTDVDINRGNGFRTSDFGTEDSDPEKILK